MLAAVPTAIATYLLVRSNVVVPAFAVALLQGALAAILTQIRHMAPWWRVIQLLFPVALLGAQRLHLPPPVAFGLFVFLLLVFWSTFRTQVPYYPSGKAVWQAVADVLPADRALRLIDIGSGLGGLVLDLARRRSGSEMIGIELAPLPWLVSVVRARATRSAARFVRGDYERLDFADYDVVFAYLSPAAMPALWRKAAAQMRPATMLISCEFSIPDKAPSDTIFLPSGRELYVWKL
jgi:SAM-dependent methyltransferase